MLAELRVQPLTPVDSRLAGLVERVTFNPAKIPSPPDGVSQFTLAFRRLSFPN